jgi:hypothetical protein
MRGGFLSTHYTIDYVEFTVHDLAAAKLFNFTDPSGNELAVWSLK